MKGNIMSNFSSRQKLIFWIFMAVVVYALDSKLPQEVGSWTLLKIVMDLVVFAMLLRYFFLYFIEKR